MIMYKVRTPSRGGQHIAFLMYYLDQIRQQYVGCAIGLFGEA
jgi:hypothetical protein